MHGSKPSAARAYLDDRRAHLERVLGRPLSHPSGEPVPPDRRAFLREEAEELYWNELSWERLTDEEMRGGSELVEFTFPAFLAFIDGLLLRETMPDSLAPPSPRPDVVEDVLLFLAGECVEPSEPADDHPEPAREMTKRLVDLVLYRFHGVTVEGVNRLETASSDGDE